MKKNYSLKHAALILLQCLLSTALLAQAPLPKQWDKRFGGSDLDNLYSLQQTMDGGYILGGRSASGISGDKTEDSRGKHDYWVIKIDANGIKQWDKRFGGDSYDALYSLQQTTDGGYILGGYSYSGISGDKSQPSQGSSDYWIVKIDASGVKQWDKRFGGSNDDKLYSLQQTTDGGYILGGYSASGISGDKTQDNRGDDDYWVVKIDANGEKQWDKRFGGSSDDYFSSLQQTTDGGYILGGLSTSGISGDKTQNSRGNRDYWTVKIDGNGIKQWDRRFGGSGSDWLNSLQQTTDGGYILGGFSSSGISGDKTEDRQGATDYWAVKIAANGIKQWDKRFGGDSYDALYSLQQTTDGGYILGGRSTSGIGGDKSEASRGNWDLWIVKTDADGIKQWDKRFGGSDDDFFYSVQQTSDAGYILGGFSKSGISGDKTEDNRGDFDYWIVKLGCPPSAKVAAKNGRDLCQTGSVKLVADASPGVKFQWLKEGYKIPGATKRTYTATDTGRYRVVVYTSRGCSQVSDVITVINSCGKIANTLLISPNPSYGIVTVTYNSNTAGNVQLHVYDKTGKLMFSKTEHAIKGSNNYQLNLSNLINGIYNLQLKNGSENNEVKFVIEK